MRLFMCGAIGCFVGIAIDRFIFDKTRTLSPKDRETVKQALRDQIEDIRAVSRGCYDMELSALSNALCEVVDRLKTL